MKTVQRRLRAGGALALTLASAVAVAAWIKSPALAAPPAPPTTAPAADLIDRLKPGEWCEIPDSHLESVAAPQSKFHWLSGGFDGIIGCWAGGAFDSQRDRLYIGPGGGHAGYNGNEVYAFDLTDLKWRRLNDPDPVIPGTEYTDMHVAPFAMHTYDGVEYLPPPTDRYVVVGGWRTPLTYALDPDRPQHWEVYPGHGTGRTGDLCAADPATGLLWLSTPITAGKLSQWDPLTHRWTLRRNDSPEPSYYETADIDYKRELLVSCGRGKVKAWHLAPIPHQVDFQFLKTTGGDAVVNSPSPGFCYDSAIDRFVGWSQGGDVYTLDVASGAWRRCPPAPTNRVTPGPPDQWGTFGRFRYVASKNVFVLCNSVKQNVYVYRLSGERPNEITGVEATAARPAIDAFLPAPALSVRATYADGSSRVVTDSARYVSLDPLIARVDSEGRGVVTGLAPGSARIRAVYSDPALRRGFGSEITLQVRSTTDRATLDSLAVSYPDVTIVAGDSFPLEATGAYSLGPEHFEAPATKSASWSSGDANVARVEGGVVRAVRAGDPVELTATLRGKSARARVSVVATPTIRRIRFQVKDVFDRPGWAADNGKPYADARGFGWLSAGPLDLRDDRTSSHNLFFSSFVVAHENRFKVKVPAGYYAVRVAMGDYDYGAVPFAEWTALGGEKLLYYEGIHNTVANRIVRAGDDGLVFTVNGKINYLIVAPVGIDLGKYADDVAETNAK